MSRNIYQILYYKLPKIHLQALFFRYPHRPLKLGIDILLGQQYGEIGALFLNILSLYHQNQYLEHS